MRLLYVTDTHIRGTSPRSRLDDFPRTLLGKLREVVALARQSGVSAILHGGDLFDRPDVAPAVAREFLGVLRESPCPIYGIAGNHDMFGFNPETVNRAMLGLFDGFGLFRLLRPGDCAWIEAEGLRVQVTGQEFHSEIDRRDPVLDYCVLPADSGGSKHLRRPGAHFAIHLTHGMLLERPFMAGVAHTVLGGILDRTEADITFGGHYHPGWSRVITAQGHWFVNPGSLARLGNQAADYERPVQVALVELAAGRDVRVELVPLSTAKPGVEVLDRSQAVVQWERERALADFIQGIGDMSQFEVLAVQAIMERVAATGGVSDQVRVEALRRLGKAQESLGTEEDEQP